MNGILCVNKEENISSFSIVNRIKRTLKINKIGHAGTLDPMATGVLVVLLGDATKLSNYLMDEDKEYKAKVVIGYSTTTEDAQGEVTEIKEVDKIDNIDEVLNGLIGSLDQIPPMYSAIKVEGRKLYELAREGEVVERKKRTIHIEDIKRVSDLIYKDGVCEFEIIAKVSKGTYIRTLCVEIGKRLNYPAHMGSLVRTRSGRYSIENSYTLNDIKEGNFEIIDMLEAMDKYKIVSINEELKGKVLNGNKLKKEDLNCDDDLILLENSNKLIAIYKKYNEEYKAERVWN